MDNGLKYKAFELQRLIQKTYSDISTACDIVIYQDNNSKYLVSLGFLNKSYMTYLEAKRFYRENVAVQRMEFENFFKAYDNLEHELKEVISKEEQNTSWLHSRIGEFQQEIKNVNELIEVLESAR
ncbi:hypothetical protein [Bacillus pseudomycoides]|uniref:hypothetical protein n=1 Tax=Bacillus pseudomycoides TaxID=64104 RepID=UPI000BF865F5|nr:hypothetical protein [Bacillus pseudomycoides]PFY57635.1 hypothetical protein COL49_15120 [Bacillus pseudomycoides]